jgi:ABC-type phosphate/phosphonate transport system permease subunit
MLLHLFGQFAFYHVQRNFVFSMYEMYDTVETSHSMTLLSLQIAVPIHFVCSTQMFAVCTQMLLMTMFFWCLQKVMNPHNSVDLS